MQNQAKNTSNIDNQEFGSSGMTWNEATFSWDEAGGSWNNPYAFFNQAKNTGSVTNQAKS